ncbi:DKNYY domain-containing protein [Yeosuana marina]|uniref:DKNYY domain-containing protein n=1 Tax=Yeosuana marina TaxID=1565536 RepID=UPI0030C8CD4D
MENRKIIILLILFAFLSCKNPQYNHIKSDLYSKQDTLFLLQQNNWDEKGFEKNITLYDSHVVFKSKDCELGKVVDVESFKKNDWYYYDKNNVYFHNSFPGFFPSLNAVPSKSKKLIRLGYDYVSTDDKVYYQSTEIINADYSTFKVSNLHKQGVNYGFDKDNFYYKDSIVVDENMLDYLKNKSNILQPKNNGTTKRHNNL